MWRIRINSISENGGLDARERSQIAANEPRHFPDARGWTRIGIRVWVHHLLPRIGEKAKMVERIRLLDRSRVGLLEPRGNVLVEHETSLSARVGGACENAHDEQALTLAGERVNEIVGFHDLLPVI